MSLTEFFARSYPCIVEANSCAQDVARRPEDVVSHAGVGAAWWQARKHSTDGAQICAPESGANIARTRALQVSSELLAES